MSRRELYNEEKVLFFAERQEGLHVSFDEKWETTLSELVRQMLRLGLIVMVSQDDSGKYYRTTLDGSIRLAKLQIKWRRSNGKPIEHIESRLAQLNEEKARQDDK